jgi:hypothetical protein
MTDNVTRLNAKVDFLLGQFWAQSLEEGRRHIAKWDEWFGAQHEKLCADRTPLHLIGVHADDIEMARTRLGNALDARAA